MKRSFVVSMMIVFVLMTAGCAIKQADLAVVGTKRVDLSMQELEKLGENISGESVSHVIFIFLTSRPTIDEAIQDALKKVDGDIMTDVTVYYKYWTIPLIYSKMYFEVKGTAWRLKNRPTGSAHEKTMTGATSP